MSNGHVSADNRIASVRASSSEPGEVAIYILGRDGEPIDEIIRNVEEVVTREDVRVLTEYCIC